MTLCIKTSPYNKKKPKTVYHQKWGYQSIMNEINKQWTRRLSFYWIQIYLEHNSLFPNVSTKPGGCGRLYYYQLSRSAVNQRYDNSIASIFTNINIPVLTSNLDKNLIITMYESFVSWCSLMSFKFPIICVIVYAVWYYIIYIIPCSIL